MYDFEIGDYVTVIKATVHEKIDRYKCRLIELDENVSGEIVGHMAGYYVVRYCVPFSPTCDHETSHIQDLYLRDAITEFVE